MWSIRVSDANDASVCAEGSQEGIFGENREDEATSNVNAHGSSIVFIGPGCEADVCISAGARIGGYMHVFEGVSAMGDPYL